MSLNTSISIYVREVDGEKEHDAITEKIFDAIDKVIGENWLGVSTLVDDDGLPDESL